MKKLFLFIVCISAILLTACVNNKSAKVQGVFHGMKNKIIVIEEITPDRYIFIDSVKTSSKGKFSFKYNFKNNIPVFIRVRQDNDFLTLLASPGENIKLNSIINLAKNYNVEGSAGSSQVRDLNVSALNTYYKIDSLFNLYNSTTIDTEKARLELEVSNLYVTLKKSYIEFLVSNSKSLASIVALYLDLPNGMSIFGSKDDAPYFRMIADSLSKAYPTSLHVKALVTSIENQDNALNKIQSYRINQLPNINLPDIYGVNQHLDNTNGKITLLTFWSAADPKSRRINQDLKELYTKMEGKNFEIFQVSLDTDKTIWISSIIEQNLPWISVRDEAGSRSVSAGIYQINSIPANYLIDPDGNIVGKNLWGSDLDKKVKELAGE